MKSIGTYLGVVTLLLSHAAAQTANSASVKSVNTARAGTNLQVEIALTGAVTPTVETAANPDRILLDLANTICTDDVQNISVRWNGVRRVRTAQHSLNPAVTRVVIDLDSAHPYTFRTEGNRIVLTIGPSQTARRDSRGAPVAATTGNLIGVLRRKRQKSSPPLESDADDAPLPTPPTTIGPPFEPAPEGAANNLPAEARPPATPPAPVPQDATATVSSGAAGQASLDRPPVSNVTASATPANTATSFPSSNASDATRPATTAGKEDSPATHEPAALVPMSSATDAASRIPVETATPIARTDDPTLRTVFKVKYVADGVAYLEGGRAQGLAEGMKLEIEDKNLPATQGDSAAANDPRVVAELVVSGVADTSAVTDIHSPKRPVKVGDLAYLSSDDAAALVQQRTLSATRQYPAVISFSEGDTLDEEALAEVPRPPLPSVNRARGRIGIDTMETITHGTTSIASTDVGLAFRGDITRIGGTYWNLSGYWRGRITKESAASQQTLQSLINRTYHLNMTYDNPNSTLVAGFGRLYLPWAPSLDTIDGGYFGKRLSPGVTLGIFGGSTPDPSSWDYSPNRAIGGSFINFDGGEYDGFHYSSTAGAGISMVNWAIDRPFLFFEDTLSYKRDIAIYESAQLDSPKGNSATPSPGPGLGRNFFTLRVNPHPRVELDLNYNYFRDLPTFDPTLVGTGLLDKFLFQGFSAGSRVEIWKQICLSTNLGRSSRPGDAQASLNQMYGITFGRLPWLRLRTDAHYARFNSSFGTGSYESISFSRQMSDRLRLEALIGQQNFTSSITANNRARFVTGTIETTMGPHYYLQSSFTTNRGDLSYDQVMFSIGYRFDSRRKGE